MMMMVDYMDENLNKIYLTWYFESDEILLCFPCFDKKNRLNRTLTPFYIPYQLLTVFFLRSGWLLIYPTIYQFPFVSRTYINTIVKEFSRKNINHENDKFVSFIAVNKRLSSLFIFPGFSRVMYSYIIGVHYSLEREKEISSLNQNTSKG